MSVINFLLLCCVIFTSAFAHNSDVIHFPEDEHTNVSPRMNFHNHQPHHHHHLDRKLDNNEHQITDNTHIPLSFIQKLNEIDNLNDLEKYLDNQEMLADVGGIASRFGGVERNSAKMPKPAACIPTLQPVELKNSSDSNLFYFPSCTRVERCGGCCSHNLLSCQPIQTETVPFQVVVSQYSGGNRLKVKGKEIVFVEKHTKCRCDCTIKKEHCNSFQEYRPDECRCACNNLDEKRKCDKFNSTKLWDPQICRCRCRNIDDCTTGSYFDQNKCACVSIPMRRRFAELGSTKERNFNENEKYDIDNLEVSPIEDIQPKDKNVSV